MKSPAEVYGDDEEYKETESPYDQSQRRSRDRKDQDAFNKMELQRVESPDTKPSNSVY